MGISSFSRLLKHRDSLELVDFSTINDIIDANEVIIKKQQDDFYNDIYHEQLLAFCEDIRSRVNNQPYVEDLKIYLDQIIRKREVVYLKNAYKLYEERFVNHDYKTVLDWYEEPVSEEAEKLVSGRIGIYTRWDTPGLEICPGNGHFTKKLVALDPLYIVDNHQEILDIVKKDFNKVYQKRLRTYRMRHEGDLKYLPDRQMGFIFSWGHFEKLPLDIIKTHLREFNRILREGGVVMLSYNNCRHKQNFNLTTTETRLYNSSDYMIPLIESFGFDIISHMNLEPHSTIVEFMKPGTITSLRAGQTIGKINLT